MTHSNELFLSGLFKNILKTSTTISGRFFPVKNGTELNEVNVGQLITDTLGGLAKLPKKYPCVLYMPPFEMVGSGMNGFSLFTVDLFFCTNSGIKSDASDGFANLQNNTSTHTVEQDWKDMRQIAGDFRSMVKKIMKDPRVKQVLQHPSDKPDIYQRFSDVGNDNVNGIWLKFYINLYTKPCDIVDYPNDGNTSNIEVPNIFPHPLHSM